VLHEIGLERGFVQIGLEIVDKSLELRLAVIMTDVVARLLPDKFLGVQLGAGGREIQQLQMRVLGEQLVQRWAMMPGGTVEQQQDGLGREQDQQQADKVGSHGGGRLVPLRHVRGGGQR